MFSLHIIRRPHIIACVMFAVAILATPISQASARETNQNVVEYARTVLGVDYNAYGSITRELILLMAGRPDIQGYLEASLAEAKKLNPDKHTNPAQDIKSYLTYVDGASKLIPQQILNSPPDLIRDQILQSICYFYFLVDQPISWTPPEGAFSNRIQYVPEFSDWMRDFAKAWGSFLDTPESFSDSTYAGFYNDPNFRLKIGDYEPRSKWTTFNEFFARYLASPSKRPIASPDDPSIVVSPADSVPQGVWDIDATGRIMVENADEGLRVKNTRYFNVNDLLGDELKEYHDVFNEGVLTHTFLNVYDYHRYHFAVGGVVKDLKVIQQNVALEVTWDPSKKVYVPIDSTGWQFTQTRGVLIVDTGKYGLVALIPMGMAQVSSVNFQSDLAPGRSVDKGSMLGNFLFGGSDFIMLFAKEAGFVLQAPQAETQNTDEKRLPQTSDQPVYKHILTATRYGQMKGVSKASGILERFGFGQESQFGSFLDRVFD